MCGHVGIASKLLTEPLKKAFNDMLYLDVLRGEDALGERLLVELAADVVGGLVHGAPLHRSVEVQ